MKRVQVKGSQRGMDEEDSSSEDATHNSHSPTASDVIRVRSPMGG